MRVLFALVGGAVVVLTMVDFAWTTLSVRGAGPITARLSAAVWAAFRAMGRGRLTPPLLTAAGPAILVATLALWVALLWLGWLLIFLADPGAVVRSSDQAAADLSGRIYFVGFTVSTLGVGDLVPKGGLWQVLTPLAALNGLTVTTVAITYLLSVLSAVIAVRQLAAYINAVGETPQGFVVTGWDGRGFSGLGGHLSSMTPGLLHTSQSHLAYPILHYFRSERAEAAPGPAVAVLDEALTLLEHGVAPGHRPPPALVQPLRNAIDAFLDRLEPRYVRAADEVPPPPDLSGLREAGIPTVDGNEFAAAVAKRRRHRRLLLAMVREEGWEWRDLERPGRRNGRRRSGAGGDGSGHRG